MTTSATGGLDINGLDESGAAAGDVLEDAIRHPGAAEHEDLT